MRLTLSCCALLAGGLGSSAAAQESSRETVRQVLENTPATTPQEAEALKSQLLALDREGIAALCDQLVEPGTGDDTPARMALHALAWLAGTHEGAVVRADFVAALTATLSADNSPDVKRFVVEQLQLGGDRSAIPALAKALHEEAIAPEVALAIEAIAGEEAQAALRAALPEVQSRSRLAVINALGRLRDSAAAPALQRLLDDPNEEVRFAAAGALVALGVAPEAPAQEAALADADSGYRAAQRYAYELQRRAAAGETTADAAGDFLADAALSSAWKAARLAAVCEALGERAIDALVRALDSNDAALRMPAVECAVQLRGEAVTEALAERLEGASPAARAGLLDVLRRRGDAAALPAVLAATKDDDRAVRIAAAKAAAALGEEQALEALASMLSGAAPDERQVVQNLLRFLPGADVSRRLSALVADQNPATQVGLLIVLAQRRDVADVEFAYELLDSDVPGVRIAATKVIAARGKAEAVDRLMARLAGAVEGVERQALEDAVVAVCERSSAPEAEVSRVASLVQKENANQLVSLLAIVSQLGGEDALRIIRAAQADERPVVRDAGYRVLMRCDDTETLPEILKIAKDAQEETHHVQALRAYVRLVGQADSLPWQRKLELFEQAITAARRGAEKKQVFAAIATIRERAAIEMLEPYLDDEELKPEVASAMLTVARGLLPGDWRTARAAVEKVLAGDPAPQVRHLAEVVQKQLDEVEGFITDWLVAGPYAVEGKNGLEIFEVAFPPEKEGADVEWRRQPINSDPAEYWLIDLNASAAGSNCAAYLRTRLESPSRMAARLELGSDDGIKVWLNGKLIHANNALRGCERGQDVVPIQLEQGHNELLLKVVNGGGGFAACARVRDHGGRPLPAVQAEIDGNQ